MHSYYCVPSDEDAVVASAEYGVQFHPEKSSKKGLQVLSNFVQICKC